MERNALHPIGPKIGEKSLAKVVTVPQQLVKCPNCDSPHISLATDGSWRCGRCGQTGARPKEE